MKFGLAFILALLPALAFADEATAIRALRDQSNLGLLNRQVDPVLASLSEDFTGVASGTAGVGHVSKAQLKNIYLNSFADPDYVSYVRQIRDITISDDGLRAVEHGVWVGVFKGVKGSGLPTGEYLALWGKRDGKWLDVTETYVTLHCAGPQC